MRGWYDEVLLLYGPVGHTHNGIDADHKIHNQDLGAYTAGTLGEWVSKYHQVCIVLHYPVVDSH